MTESQPDPITRPNSALSVWPFLAQLHLVNAGLERKPYPREHYSRQFSVTPERQTPESQRTPSIAWTEPDRVAELKEAKECAANEANRLGKFFAGRLLLKKEEPERYGFFGEDTEYWDSQTAHWKSEYERLEKEYNRRRQWEAEGRATDGWAQSMLLSPIKASPRPPSDGILLATSAGLEKKRPTSIRASQQPVSEGHSPNRGKESSQLSLLTFKDGPNNVPLAPGKRKHTERTDTHDLRGIKRKPHGSQREHSRVTKTTTKKARRDKRLDFPDVEAPRSLPWTLRSRRTISYRETGTRMTSRKKRRPVDRI
ncbi:hypothetical protein BDR22DRAFT_829420 [Usnea florida]